MKKIIYMLLLVQSGLMIAQKNVVTASGEKITISPFANNGLSTSGNYTQLGGSLIQNSVLTTNSYTLAIMGLSTGTTTDNILVADPTTGVLKKLSISSLPAPATAWSTTGNTGTTSANFLGTTDTQPLRFRIEDTNSGSIAKTNTALGYKAFNLTSTGSYNTAIGDQALTSNTTGSVNVAVGTGALQSNTIGGGNNAFGYSALYSNVDGSNNNAFGNSSLSSFTGGVGSGSNSAFGGNSLGALVNGTANSAFGFNSLKMATSSYNSALGHSALLSTTTGANNTAMGYGSFQTLTTGSNNTGLGYQAGFKLTGNNNIALGNNAGYHASNTYTGDKNILIGDAVNLSRTNAANELNIGNALFGTGVNNATIGSAKIGINTNAPGTALHVKPAGTGADPLTVEGLNNTGAATDKMLVVDGSGVVKTVNQPSAVAQGTLRIRRVTNSSTSLADASDDVLMIDATGATAGSTITVTVPSSIAAGRVFTIKRVDSLSATIDVKIQFPGIVDEGPGTTITVGDKVTYQVISEGGNKWQTISRF